MDNNPLKIEHEKTATLAMLIGIAAKQHAINEELMNFLSKTMNEPIEIISARINERSVSMYDVILQGLYIQYGHIDLEKLLERPEGL